MIRLFSTLVLISSTALALHAEPLVPVADMTKLIPGTSVQPIVQIADEKLELWANKLLPIGTQLNLPGWNAATQQQPIAQDVVSAFAVRTPPAGAPGTSHYHISVGVGRSGILEKTAPGDNFGIVNGVPMKGLTRPPE